MSRCLVLNANYEYLAVIDRWIDALSLVLTGKAVPIEQYDRIVRSATQVFTLPAVVVMTYQVQCRRRRPVFDAPLKQIVFARDGFACQYCGVRITMRTGTRDHVIPRSRGGRDHLANVVAACSGCNLRKGAAMPEEIGMRPALRPRSLTEEEKLGCLMRTVRAEERHAWLACLRREGIQLWTRMAA